MSIKPISISRGSAKVLPRQITERLRRKAVKRPPSSGAYPNEVEQLRQSLACATPLAGVPGLRLSLLGQLPSGKNQIRLRWEKAYGLSQSDGIGLLSQLRKHPDRRFFTWRDDAMKQLLPQVVKWRSMLPLTTPMMMYVAYWPGDHRTRDRSGMLDALFHLFERAGIIANDRLIEDPLWRTMPLDKKHPRVVIVLRPYFPLESPTLSYRPQLDRPSCAHCWMPTSPFPLSIPA